MWGGEGGGRGRRRALTHPQVTTSAKQREMAKAMPAVRPCCVVSEKSAWMSCQRHYRPLSQTPTCMQKKKQSKLVVACIWWAV